VNGFAAWKRMMSYLKYYRRWAVTAFVGILGGIILMIIIPMILRSVIDVGIANEDADFMLAAGLLVVGLGVIRGLMGFFSRFFGERLSHHIAYDIRNEIYNKVQNLSFSYHNQSQTGVLITRAISDVDEIQRYFAFALIDGLMTGFLVIGVSVVMFATSPLLAVISLLPMIPLFILSKRFAGEVGPRWKNVMDHTQNLSEQIQENATGAQVVRAFARENYEINKFYEENERLYHTQLGLIQRWAGFIPISAFIVALSSALVLFFGGLMEINGYGGVTVGIIVAFNAYVLLLAQPMRFVGFVILLTTQAVTSSERVFEVLDAEETITSKPEAIRPDDMKGYVHLENITFYYDDGHVPALKNINLKAEPGKIIALLGQTGSGKSTLVSLIPRFFDPTEGRVMIDGINVRDMELHALRQHIGIVTQDSFLFSATVRENIAYGRPDASEEEVIAAAKAANAHPFISELPNGYDTEIGERGVTLSGGQRQRTAIARALLVDPQILILDDSTSSVDTKTEFEIQEALSHLMKDRTTFVIAQRLTTVQNADLILVMDNGEIAEQGTHQELLEKDGLYADIYRLQLADQERLRHELMALGGLVERKEDKRSTSEQSRVGVNSFSGD
jgi:ATP-binding cassette subfamily B protein